MGWPRYRAITALALGLAGCPGGNAPTTKAPVPVEAKTAVAAPARLPLAAGALRRLGSNTLTHPELVGMRFLDDGRLLTWGEHGNNRSAVRIWTPDGQLDAIYGTGVIVDTSRQHLLVDRDGLEVLFATTGRRIRRAGPHDTWDVRLVPGGKAEVTHAEDGKVTLRRPGADPVVLDAQKAVTALTFGAQGKRLVTAAKDERVRVWDLEAGTETLAIEGDNTATLLSMSDDGRRLAMDEPAAVWDLEEDTALLELPLAPRSLALSPDGKRLALVHEGDLVVYDVDGERLLWMRPDLDTSYGAQPRLAFSPDGRRLAAATEGSPASAHLFATETGKPIGMGGVTPPVQAMVAAAGEVWVGDGKGDIIVFDPAQGDEVARLRGHDRAVRALAASPSGRWVASSGEDGQVILWDRKLRSATTTFVRLKPSELAFVDDTTLLVGHEDGDSVLWSLDDPAPDLWRLDTEGTGYDGRPPLEGRAPLSAGGTHFVLTHRSAVALFDARSGQHLASLPRGYAYRHRLSPDGTRLAMTRSRELVLWDVEQRKVVHHQRTEGSPRVAWAAKGWMAIADGSRLLVLSPRGETLREVNHGQGHIEAVSVIDDDRFVTASLDGQLVVWQRSAMPNAKQQGKPLEEAPPADVVAAPPAPIPCGKPGQDSIGALPRCALRRFGPRRFGHDSSIERLTFSPDGRYLAAEGGSYDHEVTIWNTKTGLVQRRIPLPSMPLSVVFHPDGQSVYVRADRRIGRWPLSGGAPHIVSANYSEYDATAVDVRGTHLALGDAYGTVSVLDAATLKQVSALTVGFAPVRRLGFIGEDGLLAQTLGPKTAVWRWRDGQKTEDVYGGFAGFTMLPDGRLAGVDANVLRIGVPPKVYRTKLEVDEDDDLALARDGTTVAITVTEHDKDTYEDLPERVDIYDLKTQTKRRSMPIGDTDAMALSPDGSWLAVAKGSSVVMWNTTTSKPRRMPRGLQGVPVTAGFADGGKTVVTVDRRAVLRWNASTGKAQGKILDAPTSDAVLMRDGKSLVAIDDDDAAVWPLGSPRPKLKDLEALTIDDPAVSPDGKLMAYVDYNAVAFVVELPDMTPRHKFQLPEEDFTNVVFVAPQKVIVGGSSEKSWVIDATSGKLAQTLPAAGTVATAPDGSWTLVGNAIFDDQLNLTGRLDSPLNWAPLAVSHHAWVAMRDAFNAVQIYDLRSQRRVLRLPSEAIGDATVSPDGQQLLTAGREVILWDIASLMKPAPKP